MNSIDKFNGNDEVYKMLKKIEDDFCIDDIIYHFEDNLINGGTEFDYSEFVNKTDKYYEDIKRLYSIITLEYNKLMSDIQNKNIEFIYSISLQKITEAEIQNGITGILSIDISCKHNSIFFKSWEYEDFGIEDNNISECDIDCVEFAEGIYCAMNKDYTFEVRGDTLVSIEDIEYMLNGEYNFIYEND